MGSREKVIDNYADRSVLEFDANPVAKGFLRRLADDSPAAFLRIAMKHLKSDAVSEAHSFLSALVLQHDDITEYLANPLLATREMAGKLFRRLLAVDSSFDLKLARKLPNRYFSNQSEALSGARATRVLDILDYHSCGRRLLPILAHLPNSPDARLAAKGVLFVGRRVQNPAWSSQLMSRPEPRIRANAIESLWGMDVPLAIQLLEQCVEDPDNRVQGNALVGLHMVGRHGVDTEVLSLSRTNSPPHRSTAAWAMSKMAERRWIEVLTLMIRDEHPMVRSRALCSLRDFRRMADALSTSPAQNPAEHETAPDVVETADPPVCGTVPETSQPEAGDRAEEPIAPVLAGPRLDGSSYKMSPRAER